MKKNIDTTKFGNIEAEIVHFENGIFGFKKEKDWTIVDPCDSTYILWLQSSNNPNLALPIIEANIFNEIKVDGKYFILTIPPQISEMSYNEQAPLLIKNNKGQQKHLQDKDLSVNKNCYYSLKKFIINISYDKN